MGNWYLFSSHGLVLLYVHRHPGAERKEIASATGLSERQVSRVVIDLVKGELLRRVRVGRRHTCEIIMDAPCRHPLVAFRTVGELLACFADEPG